MHFTKELAAVARFVLNGLRYAFFVGGSGGQAREMETQVWLNEYLPAGDFAFSPLGG